MRKVFSVTMVALALTLSLAAEGLATAAPKATADDRVKKDGQMTVIATDCAPGPGYTANVVVIVVRADNSPVIHWEQEAEADGTTEVRVPMRVVGTFRVRMTCIHEFSNGDQGVWYEETEIVTVEGLTTQERKTCKKKSSKKKRHRCMKQQRND